MYAATDATTEAARVFFISFSMLATLLLAQLIIGVIVNLFSDVKRLNSEQLYSCLADFTGTADANERSAIEDDVLKLNTTMLPLHGALDIFSDANKSHPISFDKNGRTNHIFFRMLRTMSPGVSVQINAEPAPSGRRSSCVFSDTAQSPTSQPSLAHRGRSPIANLVAEKAK